MTCDPGIGFESSGHIRFALYGYIVIMQQLANREGNTLTAERVTRKVSLKAQEQWVNYGYSRVGICNYCVFNLVPWSVLFRTIKICHIILQDCIPLKYSG